MLLTNHQPWTFQLALQQTENDCNCMHEVVGGDKTLVFFVCMEVQLVSQRDL